MAKKSTKVKRTGLLVVLALAAFVAAAAATYYATAVYQAKPETPGSGRATARPPVITEVPLGVRVTIFVPQIDPEGSYLVPVSVTARRKGEILDTALEALLRAGQSKGRAAGLIPEGTRLLSPVKVEDGVAVVDLSREFVDNFQGGTDQESLMLNSIGHTLVHNSEGKVSKARILVEGEKAETLGAFDISVPIDPDSTKLKPQTK